MRFAIWLPLLAASDAKNGRLSATSLRHAPASFDHALSTTHRFLPQTAISCVLTSWARRGLINRSTTPKEVGAPTMAPSALIPASLWLVLSRHSYKYPLLKQPSFLRPTLSPFRLKRHSKSPSDLPSYLFSNQSFIKMSRAPR